MGAADDASSQLRDPIDPPLRSLAPPVCTNCDYSLHGLPPGTRCPECGAETDPSVITIEGWGAYSRANVVTMRPRDSAMTLVFVVALGAWWLFESFGGRRHFFPTIWIVAYVGWFGFLAFRRWMSVERAGPPMRLRISPRGFEQRIGPGPLKLTAWHPHMRLTGVIGSRRRHTIVVRWAMRHFALSLTSELIAFEYESDREQAVALEARIRRWMHAAQGEPQRPPTS